MSARIIIGNLATDPETVPAGTITITKLRVIENTGAYRNGQWAADAETTTHFVDAKFELGENVAATLHRGDPVIVVGHERTESWGDDDMKRYGRVIDAVNIGPDLRHAVAQVMRVSRKDSGE
jgi:single-strand DNA-binding protein